MNSRDSLILLLGFLVILGCSNENKNSDTNSGVAPQPVEQLDPYSATLYPAKKEAKAQDFTVTLLNGETFTLSEQQGKVVVMNIWATWCAPCHDETPDFVDLYNQYREEGLVILGVSIDEQGKSVVKPFMEKYEVNYPMFIDDGSVMDKYGPTMGIPTTYIINKKGNLQYFAVGALTQKELEPRINRLLNE
ncbi:TlpA family protein disulfide reductase [Balneolaceae bacterium YR4-1]|uniref:TlpA family protein disulfide reductase n=1 Tax=Halalkalibaculum roseum TaxID=2709311 RepID=A0A6M1T590_9BACT|nr:TlpA disulfide reductase family protein [Halalkalibaculum roseum]NGP75503.1 TlpA family protein disulfide reductase [Halalkalibaculum roseum]